MEETELLTSQVIIIDGKNIQKNSADRSTYNHHYAMSGATLSLYISDKSYFEDSPEIQILC